MTYVEHCQAGRVDGRCQVHVLFSQTVRPKFSGAIDSYVCSIIEGIAHVDDDAEHWRGLVATMLARRLVNWPSGHVQALTPVRALRGASRPVVVDCDDGRRYVVKGRQVNRALVADQVVGRLAAIIGAPVPLVELVHVSGDLIEPGSLLEHFASGMAHASQFIPGCTDSFWIQHVTEPGNPERFASLAVLYGWADPEDRQFLYANQAPHLVYSVDHGRFFTGSSDWTIETLRVAMTTKVDQLIEIQAGLNRNLMRAALSRLSDATDQVIAEIVATPPEDWGITLDERAVLAQYLGSRRDALLAGISA